MNISISSAYSSAPLLAIDATASAQQQALRDLKHKIDNYAWQAELYCFCRDYKAQHGHDLLDSVNHDPKYEPYLLYTKGVLFHSGDPETVLDQLQKAGDAGLPLAYQERLLCLERWRREPPADASTLLRGLIKELERRADEKDPAAMTRLGVSYARGLGVAHDLKKATELFEAAAQQGHAFAMLSLGNLYAKGMFFGQDLNTAFNYYEQAAQAGDAFAMAELSIAYQNGAGIGQDLDKALEWRAKAAACGGSYAMYYLGKCYAEGTLVVQNAQEAFEWYKKAAALGHVEATFQLGRCYMKGLGVAPDTHKAFEVCRTSVALGHSEALFVLGSYYVYGSCVDQDLLEGYRLWVRACNDNNFNALIRIAQHFPDADLSGLSTEGLKEVREVFFKVAGYLKSNRNDPRIGEIWQPLAERTVSGNV